tara:strand:- start:766 stop:1371 length:606 start_codon:yes stop_codon:yes gene_type:complete
MRVLIVGAYGVIGKYVTQELRRDTDIVTASYSQGDLHVDLSSIDSINEMYDKVNLDLDAVVCVASRGVVLKHLTEIQVTDYRESLQQKFFGQIQLVLAGIDKVKEGGSFTLTTGIMNRDFIKHGSAPAVVNSAVEGFVRSACLEMPKKLRLNAVSPALLEDSVEAYADYCPGYEPVSGQKVARSYRRSIYGIQTGQIFHPE